MLRYWVVSGGRDHEISPEIHQKLRKARVEAPPIKQQPFRVPVGLFYAHHAYSDIYLNLPCDVT